MIAVLSPSNPAGKEVAWGLMAAAAMYFAPTLLAVARRRGAAPLTFSFNLFLGWTGVGWVLAWLLALADRRLHIYVASPGTMRAVVPPEQPPSITLAPDGRHWWDGYAWRDGCVVAPLGALWSPDRAHWFTGARWVSVGPAGRVLTASSEPFGGGGTVADEPEWWRRVG